MYTSASIKIFKHIVLIVKVKCCMFNILLHYGWTVCFFAEVSVTSFAVTECHNSESVNQKIIL